VIKILSEVGIIFKMWDDMDYFQTDKIPVNKILHDDPFKSNKELWELFIQNYSNINNLLSN